MRKLAAPDTELNIIHFYDDVDGTYWQFKKIDKPK